MPAIAEISTAEAESSASAESPEPCRPSLPLAELLRPSSRRDLRASLGDGATYGVTVGIGENYLSAFVLALGMGPVAAGLMATVPMLAGALLQLATPWGVHRLRSHRIWVIACATGQAASLLLLPVIALAGVRWGWLAFLAAILYWGAGLATGPAWNTWIEELVPSRVRARFLGRRSRFYQFGMLAGFLAAGFALQAGAATGHVLAAFAGLFALAAASRFASAGFLTRHGPGRGLTAAECRGSSPTLSPALKKSFARLLTYLLTVQAAVYISGPYFTPYMLSLLKFSYLQYALLVALGYIGKAALMPLWGKLAQRTSAYRLLWIGGVGIVPMSSLWMVSDHLGYLMCLQLFSGLLWGAYELGMLLIFFEALPKAQRLRLLTIYNVGNSAAMVAGSLLGAALLKWADGSREVYFVMFAMSSVARLLALGLLARVPAVRQESDFLAEATSPESRRARALDQPVVAPLPTLPRPTLTARGHVATPLEDAA